MLLFCYYFIFFISELYYISISNNNLFTFLHSSESDVGHLLWQTAFVFFCSWLDAWRNIAQIKLAQIYYIPG